MFSDDDDEEDDEMDAEDFAVKVVMWIAILILFALAIVLVSFGVRAIVWMWS